MYRIGIYVYSRLDREYTLHSLLYLQSTPHFFNVKKQFDKNTNNNYFKNKVDYIAR